MSSHECPINGCTEQVSSSKLMCRRHWLAVPWLLQRHVYDAYRDRDRSGGVAKHLQACENATAAVEDREPRELFDA